MRPLLLLAAARASPVPFPCPPATPPPPTATTPTLLSRHRSPPRTGFHCRFLLQAPIPPRLQIVGFILGTFDWCRLTTVHNLPIVFDVAAQVAQLRIAHRWLWFGCLVASHHWPFFPEKMLQLPHPLPVDVLFFAGNVSHRFFFPLVRCADSANSCPATSLAVAILASSRPPFARPFLPTSPVHRRPPTNSSSEQARAHADGLVVQLLVLHVPA